MPQPRRCGEERLLFRLFSAGFRVQLMSAGHVRGFHAEQLCLQLVCRKHGGNAVADHYDYNQSENGFNGASPGYWMCRRMPWPSVLFVIQLVVSRWPSNSPFGANSLFLRQTLGKEAPDSPSARGALHYLPFLASQPFMKVISPSCALITPSASLRISASLPYCRTILAMSIAPW